MAESTYYVALPFMLTDSVLAPGDAIECVSASSAIMRAEALARLPGNVGAIAFSRTGNPDVGKFEDAIVLLKLGHVPDNLPMLY